MNIEEINNINRNHMLSETRTDLKFEWDDKEIMEIILKQIKQVYPYSSDPQEFIDDKEYLNKINGFIHKLNRREISDDLFLNNMEKILKELLEKFETLKYQYKYDINYYRKNLKMANRLLIDGDGGIGKSYFLFQLEEKLRNSNINHLCIYCKYTKSIPDEIVNSIKSNNNEFYLIIDAFNELEKKEQEEMIKIVEKLLGDKNINIIISYRTKNLEETIKEQLEKLLENTYTFSGVEYESSITKVIETYGVEATKFIDILETNNPFYLKMLYTILEDPKIKKEEIGDLVQITFVLESYIKSICGREYWENTKKIGEYMFENSTTSIDENEIKNVLDLETDDYISKMMDNNLIDFYIYDNKKIFIFNIQRLSDFIIARPLHQKIDNLNDQEIIDLVNEKLSKMYSLSEPFIILIFDRFKKKNIKRALNIILASNLKDTFELSTLRKIFFSKEQIDIIQKELSASNLQHAFLELGGYYNRPFNCSNYITEKLIESKSYIKGILTNFYDSAYIMKLKNMLYSIIFIDENNEYIEETFWYSFWLTSVPNDRIRNLATKVLFDVVDKFQDYAKTLIDYYYKVEEYYIRKAIIRVLTSINTQNDEIIKFLSDIYVDYNQVDAEIIFRISNFLNKDTEYILLNKYNIYGNLGEKDVVDKELDLNHIIFIADIYERDLLHFERYNKENELSLYKNFILNDKKEILEWNKELSTKFACVYNEGYCKYSIGGERFKKHMKPLEIVNIDSKKMFIAFQKVFIDICKTYNYSYSKQDEKFDEHINKFENSLLKKILLISQDILLGSLMCNYYTEELSVLNDDKTFGYTVYEPIRIDEEELRIYTPVSIYCEKIDRLNTKICNRLDLYGTRDEEWFNNSNISVENIKKLFKPILDEGKEWTLISVDIHRYVSDNNSNHIYTESYDYNIVIDSEQDLIGDSESKELTIDNEEYIGNINKYKQANYIKSTRIRNIESYSDIFKETHMKLPPTVLLSEFNLTYNRKYSTWDSADGEPIIYCDNNSKEYYKNPVTGVIYIRTDYLAKLIEKHKVKYWAYTEKNYLNKGWNEDASLHMELDDKGNVKAMFKNNNLVSHKSEVNEKCKECKFEIYQESSKPVNYSKSIIGLNKFIWNEDE